MARRRSSRRVHATAYDATDRKPVPMALGFHRPSRRRSPGPHRHDRSRPDARLDADAPAAMDSSPVSICRQHARPRARDAALDGADDAERRRSRLMDSRFEHREQQRLALAIRQSAEGLGEFAHDPGRFPESAHATACSRLRRREARSASCATQTGKIRIRCAGCRATTLRSSCPGERTDGEAGLLSDVSGRGHRRDGDRGSTTGHRYAGAGRRALRSTMKSPVIVRNGHVVFRSRATSAAVCVKAGLVDPAGAGDAGTASGIGRDRHQRFQSRN